MRMFHFVTDPGKTVCHQSKQGWLQWNYSQHALQIIEYLPLTFFFQIISTRSNSLRRHVATPFQTRQPRQFLQPPLLGLVLLDFSVDLKRKPEEGYIYMLEQAWNRCDPMKSWRFLIGVGEIEKDEAE